MANGRLLFLGYDRGRTRLIDLIARHGWDVEQTDQKVQELSGYDLVVSFGYRHILKTDCLQTAKRPVLNLHMAYLPWNRGAHPLFWAMYDGAPAGVTIHEIDSGIDTGPICFQSTVSVDAETETFATAHRRLIGALESLFEMNAKALLDGSYIRRAQDAGGSFKRVRDLPSGFSWAEMIGPTIRRLKDEACSRKLS